MKELLPPNSNEYDTALDDGAEIELQLTYDQSKAWEILHDATTNELLFGGGAGGGKTALGCSWAISLCLTYQGIRGLIGRSELKALKESTLLTFFETAKRWGLEAGRDFVYNQQDSVITFVQTGSAIYLRELAWMPTDPNYDRLGSTEYTFAFIDEAQQVRLKAKNIVRSRLRFKLAENGLIPKLLMTCNPHKGFLYTEFYRPSKEGKLPVEKKMIIALVAHNRFIDPTYIKNLQGLDKETKERLLYGNWEYDDDPATMITFDLINDLFTNAVPLGEKKYIIADVARQGRDRTVLSYWEGKRCKRIAAYTKLPLVPPMTALGPDWSVPSVAGKLQEWRTQYQVSLSHVLADEDGMGGGVIDFLKCKGFMGGRRPFPSRVNGKPENYLNLKTQCAYKLQQLAVAGELALDVPAGAIRDLIVEELEQLKTEGQDKDGKRRIVGKDVVKEKIGRSPDFLDNLIMRMYYEFAPTPSVAWL